MEHTMKKIPISQIDDFPNHPFQVRMDNDMAELIDSVQERGVLTPLIVRQKEDGRYECISGHRRKKAAELAGSMDVWADIRELTPEEATILMVESNYQRSYILPSEKAFSYKMRLEALNSQGKRTDLTFSPLDKKLRSGQELASKVEDSQAQIYRYVRLTELLPELLKMVDEGKMAFRPAVEISYLTSSEQQDLLDTIYYEQATPSLSQALTMKDLSKNGNLDIDRILDIMSERKPNQQEKIYVTSERIKGLIPKYSDPKKTEEYIIHALEVFQKLQKRARQER